MLNFESSRANLILKEELEESLLREKKLKEELEEARGIIYSLEETISGLTRLENYG